VALAAISDKRLTDQITSYQMVLSRHDLDVCAALNVTQDLVTE
jgi:hypothetical protein